MRCRILCFVLVALLVAVPSVSLAHSGRTDSNGGHYNRSTGEYHYHHGYPEHDHPGGVCSYRTASVNKPTATAQTITTKFAESGKTSKTADDYIAENADRLEKISRSVASLTSSSASSPPSVSSFYTEKQSANGAFILLAFTFGILVGIVAVSFVCIGQHRDKRKLQQELKTAQDQLKRKNAEIESTTAVCASLREASVKSTSELKELENQNRLLGDFLVGANLQHKELQRQLDDLGRQYNDLYSVWSESQLVGIEHHAVIGEAMVYVGQSGIYHSRIHGDWRKYKLIPLREAIALHYKPCSICIHSDR